MRITIWHRRKDPAFVERYRSCLDEIWTLLLDEADVDLSIEALEAATDTFSFEVPKAKQKKISRAVFDIVVEHNIYPDCHVKIQP